MELLFDILKARSISLNLRPPPDTDNINELTTWCIDLYRFLQHPVFQSVITKLGIQDTDGDTKVQVEEAADEDKIRFDTGDTERAVLDSSGLQLTMSAASPPQTSTLVKDNIVKGWIQCDNAFATRSLSYITLIIYFFFLCLLENLLSITLYYAVVFTLQYFSLYLY